jgi:xylan 1,4-beta-xylosidase
MPGFGGQFGEPYARAAQGIRPCDVTGGLDVSGHTVQVEVEAQPPSGIQRRLGQHGQAFFAKVENHSAGDAIETGVSRGLHLVADTMPPIEQIRHSGRAARFCEQGLALWKCLSGFPRLVNPHRRGKIDFVQPSKHMTKNSSLLRFSALLIFFLPCSLFAQDESIVIDGSAAAHSFPHFWEQVFGSGRAALSLRDGYRQDLRRVKQIPGFKYIRFHAIFHDEVGVYDEDKQGNAVYNFSYVDQIYDGLLANGVRPFVELSFMPRKLAAKEIIQAFWYQPNVAPPKDWNKWDELVTQFTRHLIERYGIEEVSQWYFEVWNEPNLDFWGGDPRQATYWDLYDHTARALKAVSPKLRVGGPTTAQAAWADAFIKHCAEQHIPVDFVSSHVYGNDKAEDVFGLQETIPRNQMVCRAVKKVHDQIKGSSMPDLPLIWSEFNASYFNEPAVTDSVYMGPWIADTLRRCDGLAEVMAYWSFSDVFEEQGVVKTPFYGGFGLMAAGNIPKPSFNVFKLLHGLGEERVALDSDSALLTRRKNGTYVLAVWNYSAPEEPGTPRTVSLQFKNVKARRAVISRVDRDHGDIHPAYEKMGSPRYPTAAQIKDLQHAAELGQPEAVKIQNGTLNLTLPAKGLAVVELQ